MTRQLVATLLAQALCLAVLISSPAAAQSLRGSPSSISRMYYHATDHGMYFYKTGSGLRKAASDGRFVKLKTTDTYRVAGVSYPYVQEATRVFVERLGRQYRQVCGERMVVTSAARPKSMRLANSVSRSVHPTGMAIDLRKPQGSRCRSWLRETLLSLEGRGVLEATEEYSPPHFHIAVFPTPYTRYVQGTSPTPKLAVNTTPRNGSSYRVRSGDSLWGIARTHDVTVDRLKNQNGLRSSTLQAGQVLIIPR